MLYLVHHGDAVGPDVNPMRPLSSRGQAEVDMLAHEAAARGMKPDVIFHSGKMRARQTAEAYWRCCNPLAAFSATRGLQPTDPTSWIVDLILAETRPSTSSGRPELVEGRHVMLAGHFPHLPRLLGRLLSGNPDSEPAVFPLNGVVALEQTDGKWVERWRLNT